MSDRILFCNGSGTWDIVNDERAFPYDFYVHKTTTLKERKGDPEAIVMWGDGWLNQVGLHNPGMGKMLIGDAITFDIPLICSIYGENEKEWKTLAGKIGARSNVKGIELNLSCPNIQQLPPSVEDIEEIVTWCREQTHKQLIVKLSPAMTIMTAKAAAERGADMLCVGNALETRRGGLSGPPIRSLAVELVQRVANVVSLPIIGMGGVEGKEDQRAIAEFRNAGATVIGIGSHNFVYKGE
jgi:dihydroorotate dehydrogenase (NAD+) catalytic subunit